MPTLDNLSSTASPIKAIFMGDSGTGKTGALASLAQAGYNVRMLDFDNGYKILLSALQDDAEARKRFHIEVCTDKMKPVGGKAIVDGAPLAWSKAMNLLDKWKTPEYDLGPVRSWTLRDVLVIDSLSFAGEAALRHIMTLNGRGTSKPFQSDWGEAQSLLESMLALLYSDIIRCNVVVNTHVNYYDIKVDSGQVDKDNRPIMKVVDTKGLPQAVGQALSPKIMRYFNTTLIATSQGPRKIISTQKVGIVEAKTEILKVPPNFPLASGLADYFKLIHGDPLKL